MSFSACFVQVQILHQGPAIRRSCNKHISYHLRTPSLRPAPVRCVIEPPSKRPEVPQQLFERFQSRSFTGEEYELLTKMGILEGLPVELIDGQLVFMAAHSLAHTRSAGQIDRRLFKQLELKNRAHVRKAEPILLKDGSWQPEPDVCVVSGSDRDYDNRKPTSKDILLVVEISISTSSYDRNKKLKGYASEGIMEYWIVQPEKRKVRVLRNPEGSYFKSDETISHGTIAPYAFPDCNLSLDDIF